MANNQNLGIIVRKLYFRGRNLIFHIYPFGLTGAHRTLFTVSKGFPWYFAKESPAFRTNIVYFKAIGELLKKLRDLG